MARDEKFTRLGFTCFRLIPVADPETPFAPIELMGTRSRMGIFMLPR
jgi:hypothetical protein